MKQLLILLLLCICIASCTQEEYELSSIKSKTSNMLSSFSLKANRNITWQDDLNYSLKGEGKILLLQQGLEMMEYNLIEGRTLLGKEAILQELSNETIIPIYHDSTNINSFDLLNIGNANFKYKVDANNFYSTKKEEFMTGYLDSELETVVIRWKYKNKEFVTDCLVTKEKMIYDDILSNIRYIIQEEPLLVTPRPLPRIKSRASEEDSKSISYILNSSPVVCYTGAGRVGAISFYYVQLTGKELADGTKSIDYAGYEAPHSSEPGFYAVGDIKVTNEKLGKDGQFSYQYAVGVGTRDISLTWQGSNFTMYGQDSGSTGGESLTASSLY